MSEFRPPAPVPCGECQAGMLHLRYLTYFTWLGDELITVPNFPSWVCDVCGRREYDERAISWLTTLLNPGAGKSALEHEDRPPRPPLKPGRPPPNRSPPMSMDTAPRTHRFVAADLLTPGYRVVGKVLAPNTGVTGLMNDTTNSFLEIYDARLARVHMPTKLVDHFETLSVVKSHVFAVCLARREDVGPQAIARGGYVRVTPYPARLTSPMYELEGELEWPGRFDFKAVMSEGNSDFVPLYNVKLTAILIQALKIESPAVLFNRKQVDLLALINQRAKPKEG